MATSCSKCGRTVDTLAKRRHRCVKVKMKVKEIPQSSLDNHTNGHSWSFLTQR